HSSTALVCHPCFVVVMAPPALCPLSLHDALPIWAAQSRIAGEVAADEAAALAAAAVFDRGDSAVRCRLRQAFGRHRRQAEVAAQDRKSTRLNSSHVKISYAVFCLKKKKKYRL